MSGEIYRTVQILMLKYVVVGTEVDGSLNLVKVERVEECVLHLLARGVR